MPSRFHQEWSRSSLTHGVAAIVAHRVVGSAVWTIPSESEPTCVKPGDHRIANAFRMRAPAAEPHVTVTRNPRILSLQSTRPTWYPGVHHWEVVAGGACRVGNTRCISSMTVLLAAARRQGTRPLSILSYWGFGATLRLPGAAAAWNDQFAGCLPRGSTTKTLALPPRR